MLEGGLGIKLESCFRVHKAMFTFSVCVGHDTPSRFMFGLELAGRVLQNAVLLINVSIIKKRLSCNFLKERLENLRFVLDNDPKHTSGSQRLFRRQ